MANEASLVVAASACLSSAQSSRLRAKPMTSAPTAPIAPPSVGVATPRKMVPSTKKMSSSGGMSTNVTRSARRESSPSFSPRLMRAMSSASATPPQAATTIFSSVGTLCTVRPSHQVCTAAMFCASTVAVPMESAITAVSEA